MRKLMFLLAASAALFLPATARAYCYGVTDPIAPTGPTGHVCGTIKKLGHNGTSTVLRNAGTSYVKICPQGAAYNSSTCSTVTTGSYTDGSGKPVQAFVFRNYRQGSSGYQTFDFYIWGQSSTDYWGSNTKPLGPVTIGNGVEGLDFRFPPRPLEPIPVYPTGTSVPSSYLVRWKSGMDVDRKPYPVSYEVWFKYWPFGGTEPSSWSLSAANLPCQDNGSGPDINNECSTYVPGPQLAGNWKWYVVANLDLSSILYYGDSYSTKSGWVSFVQPE